MPPCRPQKAFRLAAELMYVTGVMSAGVDHLAQFFPGGLDLVDGRHVGHRAAGGQVGQHDRHALARRGPPASGRLARMSAVSAMKCTPQKAIARQSPLSAAILLS